VGSALASFAMVVPALLVAAFAALVLFPLAGLLLLVVGVDVGYTP
jgi:hypothetical protein